MKLEKYTNKELLYQFVLMFNLRQSDLNMFVASYDGDPEDNAILAYCYFDKQCGVSFRVLCSAKKTEDGAVEYHKRESIRTMWTLRTGPEECDAEIISDVDALSEFISEGERIKEDYGHYENLISGPEGMPFEAFRHEDFPMDILTIMLSPNRNIEKMWLREVNCNENGSIDAKLLDDPFDPDMGVLTGDVVRVVAADTEEGKVPYAILPWMIKDYEETHR